MGVSFMEFIKKLIIAFDIRKFIKFGMVGVLNTIIDIFSFFILNVVFGIGAYISQILSFIIATINSFLCNKYWTFEKKNPIAGNEVFKYIIVKCCYLAVSLCMLGLFKNLFNLTPMVAKFPATCMMIGFNYLAVKFWVFK